MKKHTLSLIYHLLSLSLSHTYYFRTFTHSPSHALDLSRLRHSPRSIAYRFIEKSNITKFDHVRGEKQLHLVRQTYTIRFTMRCSFVWCIFGIVDINNICVNLIKVSKVWLLKILYAMHYRTHHSAVLGLIYLSQTLYLPGSHIHMSRSRYTYRPIQHSPPCSLSMWHAPP